MVAATSIGGERTCAAAGASNLGNHAAISEHCRFQLGCITKLLTSLVALKLTETGALDFETSIATYLPELNRCERPSPILVRHLASHTSGYQGVNLADPACAYYYSWQKFLAYMDTTPHTFAPGAVFNYEHTEAVLLGEIVRRISGQSADELARQLILAPLGISAGSLNSSRGAAGVNVADHGFDASAAGYKILRTIPYGAFWQASLSDLTISVADLLTLGEALIGAHRTDFFSSRLLTALRTMQIGLPAVWTGPKREIIPIAFGPGCAEYQRGLLGHNGSGRGQTCGFRFAPDRGAVIVVALNAWEPHIRDMVIQRIFQAICGREGASQAPCEPTPFDAAFLGRYTGAVSATQVDVGLEDGLIIWELRVQHPHTLLRLAGKEERGRIVLQPPAHHLAVGFFREPATGTPCLQLGLNAYKQVRRN